MRPPTKNHLLINLLAQEPSFACSSQPSQFKIWGKSVKGFLSYNLNKNRDCYLHIYILLEKNYTNHNILRLKTIPNSQNSLSNSIYIYIYTLREPSAVVYSHLNDFNRENKIFAIKIDSIKLESQKQTQDIPVGLLRSPMKIWGESVLRFLSYDRTNKQANRDYNFI